MEKSSCNLFHIGELAEKTGKTSRAIRFYEQRGLITPKGRSNGGYRLYDEQSLLRIEWIDRLQTLGFSIKDIKEFLASLSEKSTGPQQMQELHAFYSSQLKETELQIQRLTLLSTELKNSIQFLDVCNSCQEGKDSLACLSCHKQSEKQAWPLLVSALVKH